jgi:hypothetical protein
MSYNQVIGGHVFSHWANAGFVVGGTKHRPQTIQFGQNANQVISIVDNAKTRNFIVDNDLHGFKHIGVGFHLHRMGQHIIAQTYGMKHK